MFRIGLALFIPHMLRGGIVVAEHHSTGDLIALPFSDFTENAKRAIYAATE